MAGRLRSGLPLVNRILRSEAVSGHRSSVQNAILLPSLSKSEFSRNYATAPAKKDDNIKVPLKLFGGAGNYASALYLVAKKGNVLDKVESEIADLIEASKRSSTFSNFMMDLSVPNDTRTEAIEDICSKAKFSDVTKNFLVVLAVNGRLKNLESIAKKFSQLTMADKGEVKATVTTVIPIPPEEEKELKETLQEILGQGKKVQIEQKIDASILGGLVVEFDQKVFDMSIRTRALQMERFLREPVNLGNL